MSVSLQILPFRIPGTEGGREASAKAWKTFLHSSAPALLERARASLPTARGETWVGRDREDHTTNGCGEVRRCGGKGGACYGAVPCCCSEIKGVSAVKEECGNTNVAYRPSCLPSRLPVR